MEFGESKNMSRPPERVKHLGKGWGQDASVSPPSATLGHFTGERMGKKKKKKGVKSKRGSGTVRVWKEAETNGPGCRRINQDGSIKTLLLVA